MVVCSKITLLFHHVLRGTRSASDKLIRSFFLSFSLRCHWKSIKEIVGRHVGNPRKSFHAPFARTCSRVSERAANDVIHLIDWRRNATRSVDAKRLHLASHPTSPDRILPRTFHFLWHSESGRIAHRGNADAGGREREEGVTSRASGSAREVAGISNFTERGLTRPTRGEEKLGRPSCVTSLPVAKTDADGGAYSVLVPL